MAIDERMWKIMQHRLGYSDAELELFKSNPRNEKVLSKTNALKDKLFILEVVESNGCNSGHKVGDKIYFDAGGNLLTELSPKKVCGYSLNGGLMMIFVASEMLMQGIDPQNIKFNRANCFDVGLECGGWGKIVLELKVKDKKIAGVNYQ